MKKTTEIQGVFFCSGARNHLLLNEFPGVPMHMEFDERIASFKALGLSKATSRPTVICTTSGTAVSECLSALIEAFYSETKLILVSADRPLKLQGTGAPQTINHEIITRGHRNFYKDLSLDEFKELDLTTIDYPAHVNIRIASNDELGEEKSTQYADFHSFINSVKNPLFLFSHENKSMRPLVEKFSAYGLPFYAEVTSGAKDLSLIKTEKKLLKMMKNKDFDSVVRIGHTPLSKLWRLLEGEKIPVYSFDSRGLKGLSYGTVEKISAEQLLTHSPFWDSLTKKIPSDDQTQSELMELCSKYPRAEVSLLKNLHDLIPENAKVFLGNSLPIRYFELIQTKRFQIMASRGVNGIDGQLSTAIGWSLSTKDDVYCILGDMTFSYDITGLINMPSNLKCIIINNSGGRIFETLKMDSRLVMEHHRTFKKICEALNLSYAQSIESIPSHQIVEIFPNLEQTREFQLEWST